MENLEFFQTNNGFSSDNGLSDAKNGDHFIIDDLLNFPTDDVSLEAALIGTSADTPCNSSTFSTGVGPYFQSSDIGGPHTFVDDPFSNELGVPAYDELVDAADLEWLSTFVDDSFGSVDLPKQQTPLMIEGMKPQTRTNEIPEIHQYQFQPEPELEPVSPSPMIRSVPAKARSKRSRAAPGNWTSRLLAVSPTPTPTPEVSLITSSSESNITVNKKLAKKKEVPETSGGEGRRCLHCDTDKTPQWRTGPLGPKTLCNACGVRYKSGRLVPEYRPASSPTFVLSKHSNSHRKVLELRRQKEMMKSHQQPQFMHHHHQNMMFDVSNSSDDYLIHQHIGPDYRQMI